MIPIHRQKVTPNLMVDMPSELYKYCYRIRHNQELTWGICTDYRNKKREKVRKEAWDYISAYLHANFDLPHGHRIWMNTTFLSHGNCRFLFFCKEY